MNQSQVEIENSQKAQVYRASVFKNVLATCAIVDDIPTRNAIVNSLIMAYVKNMEAIECSVDSGLIDKLRSLCDNFHAEDHGVEILGG